MSTIEPQPVPSRATGDFAQKTREAHAQLLNMAIHERSISQSIRDSRKAIQESKELLMESFYSNP